MVFDWPRSTDGWASRPYRLECDSHGGIAAWFRLRQGFGATRCCAQLGAYIRFCETNPPILGGKTGVIYQGDNRLHRKIFGKNGGFVFENEPPGRGILRPTNNFLAAFCPPSLRFGAAIFAASEDWVRGSGRSPCF